MAKKMLFIYNPHAGKAQIKNKLMDIIDIFVKAGYEVTVYPTQKPGDAVSAAKEKKSKYDILVCSGGDGTLDEVVTGMMESGKKLPIGYIPAGSTNDFANSLMLPKNMIKAAEVVVNGVEFSCDIGSFNQGSFVYIAAFGIFTDVSYETPQEVKNMLGHMAYILEGMKRLPSLRSFHMKVAYENLSDDMMYLDDEFMFGMVTNSTSVGGFKRITGRYVELNDGLFEVTLIKKPKNPLELNKIMTALMGSYIDTDCMYCVKTGRITIESEEEISWTLDGEFGGKHNFVEIQNNRHALRIMVPDHE